MLQLVTHRCSTLYRSLSGLAESAQFGCRPLRNDQCQSMPKRNNVSYHLWVLLVRLVGRIARQLFEPLGMQRIGLNQHYLFLPQKVKHGFRVRSRGFKTHYNLFQVMAFLKLNELCPKHLKPISQIVKGKWLKILTIGRSEIAMVHLFPDIDRCYEGIPVDLSELLCFILLHGYAPPLIRVNQLAIGSNQSEYSRFQLNARLTAI